MNLPARAQLSFRDASGSIGYVSVHMGANVSIAEARAACITLAGLLSSVQAGLVLDVFSVAYRTHLSDAPGEEGSRVQERAVIVLSDGEDEYAVIAVSGVALGSFEDAGAPDDPPELLAQLVAALTQAPYTNPFGETVNVFEAAYGEFLP